MVPVPNASTIQRLEASVIESKPAPEFVMHQVPVFEHTKTIERRDNRAKHSGRLFSELYVPDTSQKSMNRHTDVHKKV